MTDNGQDDFDWGAAGTILENGGVVSGSIAVGAGMPSVVRIPVPGTDGLHVELTPRWRGGWRPAGGGSTSTLFIQDVSGRRQLRLDYGFNEATQAVEFHWNQRGTFRYFGIEGHTPAGPGGAALYHGARYYRYAGRTFLVIGAAMDMYSIVVAERRWRQVAAVASGWVGAWAGCKLAGAGGAVFGSGAPGAGTAIGGIIGCAAGGIGGYFGASWVAAETYDYVEETYFGRVPQIQPPE